MEQLDQAKNRLKDALTKLEAVIEEKITKLVIENHALKQEVQYWKNLSSNKNEINDNLDKITNDTPAKSIKRSRATAPINRELEEMAANTSEKEVMVSLAELKQMISGGK